ncbi:MULTISPECIES: MotA/TolQ/ExbB proton channel family protein [Methylomicrobium]|uniref:Biopolymer transport protein n=1 Tax=Methylomicrobium album BG8 TaxID=686340 RepID=H8GGK1_METAL|nr:MULTISPECIES: MotA/TolQ/ExbB proton channel family protein [Methylomicrobium]EIC28797.1 biopolymer transport protein [Methylomicrobium album BG8]
MFEIIKSGGWMMWPLMICSIGAMAIIAERFWTLRKSRIIPEDLVVQVWRLHKDNKLDDAMLRRLKASSPLGRIIAAGVGNSAHGREIMKESIEDVGRQVMHDLERFLDALGLIAEVSPLLGLLGTVFGMIEIFSQLMQHGAGDPTVLAGGISVALITTATGLSVAIPSLIFHRYFLRRVDEYVINMEAEALRLIEMMHGEREASL